MSIETTDFLSVAHWTTHILQRCPIYFLGPESLLASQPCVSYLLRWSEVEAVAEAASSRELWASEMRARD